MSLRWIFRGSAILVIATGVLSSSYVVGQDSAQPLAKRLATLARAAKGQFRPLTPDDVKGALARVSTAAADLDRRLAAAGKTGDDWKSYIRWDEFCSQLSQPKPDLAVLNATYGKLAAGYDGLELKWFADVRDPLRQYLWVVWAVDNAAVKPQYEQCLDGLAAQLEAWAASPTTEATQRIAEDLAWLETRRQAPELVAEVRALFTASNFQFEVNGQIVDLGVAGPVDEVAPIDDCILGTTIHGVGHTVGHSNARLAADPALGAFDVLLQAVNCSRNTGYHRPVCIQSSGTSTLSACKRFWIDSQGLHALPSVACVQVSSCISDIRATNGKQFIERIAWRKALKQEPQADAIAASHGECRLNERVDAQAVTTLDRANADYETKVHKPLSERRAFPRQIAFSTTAEVIRVSGMVAAAGQLAAPTAAPPLAGPAEISLRIHESSINNMAATVLTGMRLSDEMLQRTAKDLLGTVPERLKPDQNQDPFTIVFPKEQPITVSLADNGLTVTLRGQEYLVGERTRRSATNVMASYKFVKTEQGFKAVRQGELQFFAPGKRPGSPRGAGQQAEWMALQRKFGKIFAPEILFKGFTPEGKLAAAGKFVPVEVSARDGWLIVGWSRATPAKGS